LLSVLAQLTSSVIHLRSIKAQVLQQTSGVGGKQWNKQNNFRKIKNLARSYFECKIHVYNDHKTMLKQCSAQAFQHSSIWLYLLTFFNSVLWE